MCQFGFKKCIRNDCQLYQTENCGEWEKKKKLRRTIKVKIEDYMRRKAEDKREKDRLENDREMKPEQNGHQPERR